jgi:hypothetical protein
LEKRLRIEIEVTPDPLAVLENLNACGISLGGHVARLFKIREIQVGFDVASDARIAVPVPGPAKIRRLIDDPNFCNALLGQLRASAQTAKARADNDDIGVLDNRIAPECGVCKQISVILRKRAFKRLILAYAIGAYAFLTLFKVLSLHAVWRCSHEPVS